MNFEIKPTRHKEESVTKSIYIKRSLVSQIEQIAEENHTSFNNVVISMIESCLKEE